jgi:hypothetical protein
VERVTVLAARVSDAPKDISALDPETIRARRTSPDGVTPLHTAEVGAAVALASPDLDDLGTLDRHQAAKAYGVPGRQIPQRLL